MGPRENQVAATRAVRVANWARTPFLSVGLGIGAGALIAITGCGVDADVDTGGTTPPVVRDSAGIRVVENAAPLVLAGSWGVGGRVVLCSAAGPDGDEELINVNAAVPIRGEVAVAVLQSQRVLVCADGEVVRRLGRRGEGPGEFSRISGMVPGPADSLVIVEPARLTFLSGNDGGSRTVPLNDLAVEGARGFQSSGRTVAIRSTGPTQETDMVLLTPSGEAGPTLPAVPWTNVMGRHTVTMILFMSRPPVLLTEGGYWRGSSVGSGDLLELKRHGTDGVDQVIRAPVTVPVLTEATWSVGADEARQSSPPQLSDEMLDNMLAWPDDPEARSVSAVLELLEGPDGELWSRIPEADLKDRRYRWRIFDQGGSWVTDLLTPASFQLLRIDGADLYGVERDDFGLETVVRYVVERG